MSELARSTHRILRVVFVILFSSAWVVVMLLTLSRVQAWDEERDLYFYDPYALPRAVYSDTEVSSIHFDLTGALAIAAGFSVTDAATIQLYSQLVDSGLIAGSQVYSFAATSFPSAPPISSVMTTTHCPSPSTTDPTLTMGMTTAIECPGCFTSRWGPYNIFFHFPHDRPDELGAIRAWAFGETPTLAGVATFGYSSTVPFNWYGLVNIYDTTACFVTETVEVDTGGITAGSLEALAIYLHSLGDHWSHQECIMAADEEGKPFAAHVAVSGRQDPLWPCRWLMHEAEFGSTPDSQRTLSGILAVYQELTAFAQQSDRPLYRSIPLTAKGSYLLNALETFVHTATALNPEPRRDVADELREWSLTTRATNPEYWLFRLYLPLVLK